MSMKVLCISIVVVKIVQVRSQLLGAGQGQKLLKVYYVRFLRLTITKDMVKSHFCAGVGSCRAFPYRTEEVDWEKCPSEVPCCNEYGYCRTREEWEDQQFRDCNGVSNGIDLPRQVLQLENELGGVAGEALGAEKTFDISDVGGGAFGPGRNLFTIGHPKFTMSNRI